MSSSGETGRKWRVLVVGVGSIGERHLRCFKATGRAELSLCEVNPALRQAVAGRYGIPGVKAFDSYDAALADGPDAVVICTPAHLHTPMALAAARTGVHLLIEKPLSTTLNGVDELERAIGQHGVRAAVAYVYRAHPAMQAMRAAIRSGRFGEPVEIVAVSGQHFPFFRPAYREIYYRDRATGGGAVQDAITHVMNASEWLVGPVERLVADIDHQVLEGVSVEDTVHVIARHAGGRIMGSFTLNQHQYANESTITVICTRGTLRFEFHNSRWRWCDAPGTEWHDEVVGPLERDTLFTTQAAAFLDVLDGVAPPTCTLADAAQTLRVNLAILQSAERREWVHVQSMEMARG